MDTGKRPVSDATNSEIEWKSKDHRDMMLKRMADFFIKHGPPSWSEDKTKLWKFVERFEEEVFNSVNDEVEYNAKITAKMRSTREPLQSGESNPLPSKASSSGAEMNTQLQEKLYQKIQTMKNRFAKKLDVLYKSLTKRYEERGFAHQQQKTSEMVKCEHHMRALEFTFALFQVNKSEITPDFEEKVDKMERYIQSITIPRNIPSQSNISQVGESSTKKPSTSQEMGLHNSHLTQPSYHQVVYQSSTLNPLEEYAKQQGYVVQQQSGELTPLVTYGIPVLPFVENFNEKNENGEDLAAKLDDSSPAMQHLVKVFTSTSNEALAASCKDIGIVFHLNDDKSTLEPLNGPPIGEIGTNLEDVIVTDSQARYLSRRKFVPIERKINRFIDSVPIDNFLQLPSSEKPFSNSNTTQENYALLEEIKEINMRLIDTEVVVEKEKCFTTAPKGYIDHGEGLIVKLIFNSVSVNANPMSSGDFYEKPKIQPLWLHIPTCYPQCSAVIIDETPWEASEDVDNISMKTKLKLKLYLRRLRQPLLLKDIAMSWDRCARETICEYAQLHGGGTFTTKYGGWEYLHDN